MHRLYKFMCKACGTGWPEAANQCWVCPGKEFVPFQAPSATYKADGVTYNLLIVEAAAEEGPPSQGASGPKKGSSNLHLGAGSGRSRAPGGCCKADVTKAHRREGPQEGLAVPGLTGEEWWVNKVGTYGMASAQSYWGRLRVLYALFPQVDWNFVFVDNFLWLLRSKGAVNLAVALLATLLALGTPLSWKKTHLAEVNTWQTHPGYGGFTEGPGPHPMGNGGMSAGEIDAPATLGLEDGHHHGGETP